MNENILTFTVIYLIGLIVIGPIIAGSVYQKDQDRSDSKEWDRPYSIVLAVICAILWPLYLICRFWFGNLIDAGRESAK